MSDLDFGSAPDTETGDTANVGFGKIEDRIAAAEARLDLVEAVDPIEVSAFSAITLSASTVAENAAEDTVIGNLQNVTVGSRRRLIDDCGQAFKLNTAETQLLKGPGVLDYETATTKSPVIEEYAADGTLYLGGTSQRARWTTLSVTVTNVADSVYTIPDFFIRASGNQGTADGLSYANAKGFTSANILALWASAAAKPSGTRIIGVFADAEIDWTETAGITPVGSGTSGNRIKLIGMGLDYQPLPPVISGTRQLFQYPYTAETTTVMASDSGNPLFKMTGCNHWEISYLAPKNIGNAAVVNLTGPCTNFAISHLYAFNIQRLVDNTTSGATCTDFTISNCNVIGFSKQCIRIRSDCTAFTISNCTGDSAWQEEYPGFAVGIGFDGTAHDGAVTDTDFFNMRETLAGNSYKNGDSYSAERGNYNITYTRAHGRSNTDSVFDLKGIGHVLIDCQGSDSKRNFRFWDFATMTGCTSTDPYSRDGNSPAHVWGAGDSNAAVQPAGLGADIMLTDCVFTSSSAATKTFYGNDGARTIFRAINCTENTVGGDSLYNTAGSKSYVIRAASDPATTPTPSPNPYSASTPEGAGFDLAITFPRTVTFGVISGADAAQFSATELVGPLRLASQTYGADNVRDMTVTAYDVGRNSITISPQITVTDVTDFRVLDIDPSALADLSQAFVDTSPAAQSLTIGSAVRASADLGATSYIKMVGTGGSPNNVIQITDNARHQLEGDFEIVVPFRLPNVTVEQNLITHWSTTSSQRGWRLYANTASKLVFDMSANGTSTLAMNIVGSSTLSATTLYSARVRRSGSTTTLTLDGLSQGTSSYTGTSFDSSAALVIGALGTFNAFVNNPSYLGRIQIAKGGTIT